MKPMITPSTRVPNIWMNKMKKKTFTGHKKRMAAIRLRKREYGASDLTYFQNLHTV